MSSRVNLNDTISNTFEFSVGGLDYDLKYPTLEEIEPMTELYNRREVASKKDTPESAQEIAEIDDKLTKVIYQWIIPVGHTTPIEDTLKKQPYPVVRKFNDVIVKQLSAE